MFAVIFDMDGVLVDNSRFHERAFAEYFSQYGIIFTPNMFGRGNDDLMAELFPNENKERHLELADGKEAYYRQIYEPHIKPVDGLTELLNELKKNHIPVAVGSSGPAENIDFVLDKLKIRNYLDVVVSAAMVQKTKPAPDIYLKSAELLNTKPQNCLVFEDAPAGIKAAHSAKMKIIGVATSLPKEKLNETEKVINNFTEITMTEIKKIMT
ncbi:MAG: HAD family phosphatase [Planctomycetaceae bacterium]|jgi:beta-phosphoglucomutase family hydrolase|nr:HAD family phosphatase [Planctomycetaceae bacterium]